MNFRYRDYQIDYDETNTAFSVYFGNKRVGEFEFREDENGKVWVWNLSLDDIHQCKGIGTAIIKRAVKLYEAVYFYTGNRLQLRHSEWADYDSRYLTEEGVALLKSCLRKRIIKPEWAINPYEDRGYFPDE